MGAFDHLKGAVERIGNPLSDQPGMDRSHSSLSPVRAALLADGLLLAPARGRVDLVIPPLAGWLDRHDNHGDGS